MAIRCCSRTAGVSGKGFLKYRWDTYSRDGPAVCSGHRLAHASDSSGLLVCVAAAVLPVRKLSVHQRRPAVHASVFAGLDRFPEPARSRLPGFLSELGERHARQSSNTVSIWTCPTRSGRTSGASPLPTDPRAIESTERSRPLIRWMEPLLRPPPGIADVHARHFHSGAEGDSANVSETACSAAMASWMATIPRSNGSIPTWSALTSASRC